MSNSPTFEEVIEIALQRRSFLQSSITSACAALLVNSEFAKSASGWDRGPLFQFANVPASQEDRVVVPEGYEAQVLYRWGDPIDGKAPQFKSDASNTADDQLLQAGMGHDGMEFFEIPGKDPNLHGLLAINHEYTDQVLLFPRGLEPMAPAAIPEEMVRKSQHAHGVSIVEVEKNEDGSWKVIPSERARRITARTPMRIAGPATERIGTKVDGTVNNCSAGRTPWGTYLTCEENFNGVFGSTDPKLVLSKHQKEYGLTVTGYTYTVDGKPVSAYRWHEVDKRFDLSKADNDADRFGFVVEIDPLDPKSTPVKRTALGRFKHENAAVTMSQDGRVVVYMGDDERNEFVYKFVSSGKYDANSKDRSAMGDLLDSGTLYVAKFESDYTGKWLPLVPGKSGIPVKKGPEDEEGFDAADIAIRTREAAEKAGATPMDRPEWIAIHPESKEVYASLTNNSTRGKIHPVDTANPRAQNIFGHIVRWNEQGNDAGAESFAWKIFMIAGNPKHPNPQQHGNVAGDSFGCPDGLRFDSRGILWIQTDMSSSVMGSPEYAELGNNMMLAADPASGQVRRFLTGPKGCEITGMAMTSDRKTMFVNIQHPGEPPNDTSDATDPSRYSQWPDGPGSRPRAATIAIRKKDGGPIGS